ncbi:hypothetical protein [Nostoc sp.]
MSNKDQNTTIKQLSFITKSMPVLLKGDELKEATNRLAEEIYPKIREVQREVGTAYDNSFLELIEQLRQAYLAEKFLI